MKSYFKFSHISETAKKKILSKVSNIILFNISFSYYILE